MIQEGFDEIKNEITDFKFETKVNFEETRTEFVKTNERIDNLYTNVDGFIHMHQRLELELTAMRGYYQRLEERLAKLEATHA